MTCHDARDLYSALVDDALDAGERARVEAHVAGCAECRRELDRFRRAVSLVRQAEPVRAPAGFVDRVMAAAYPAPWYRRLAQRLFSPAGVKLPLEAAAVFLVAGIAVYVFQHTPELQQAARQETPATQPAPAPPVSVPTAAPETAEPAGARPMPSAAPAQPGAPYSATEADKGAVTADSARSPAPPAGVKAAPAAPPLGGADTRAPESATAATKRSDPRAAELPAKEGERRDAAEGAGSAARAERAVEPSAPPPARDRVLPSVLSDAPAADRQGAIARKEKADAAPAVPPPAGAPASPPTMKSAPAPAEVSPPAGLGDGRLARPRARQDAASQAAPSPGADVAGRLAVADRGAALRGLADLLGRAGGREMARRAEGDAAVVDLLLPRERYADFLRGLAQLGRLSLDHEVMALPAEVRVTLRIGG